MAAKGGHQPRGITVTSVSARSPQPFGKADCSWVCKHKSLETAAVVCSDGESV